MKGFTLVELMVSVAIFAMMTALVVVKYGSFNQSVLLTNLAYDVALTIRTAQTYGLSVKDPQDTSPTFTSAYGVTIGTDAISCAGASSNSQQFIMFADTYPSQTGNAICDSNDILTSTYAIKRGGSVSQVCAGSGSCTLGNGRLDITFKRPDPRATICFNGAASCSYSYAEIVLKASDNSTRKIIVRSNGQITIGD
jgi:prepilin-type N-terminal cleavage/methylation domain-containing protein